jgi:hypothetical protein
VVAVEHLMHFCIMWVNEASPVLLAGSGLIPEDTDVGLPP